MATNKPNHYNPNRYNQPHFREELAAQPAGTSADTTTRKAYAADMAKLSPEMRSFLAAVEGFHTQKFNVQRQKPALSPSTYIKALERVMCGLRLFFPVLFSPSLVQVRFWFVFFHTRILISKYMPLVAVSGRFLKRFLLKQFMSMLGLAECLI